MKKIKVICPSPASVSRVTGQLALCLPPSRLLGGQPGRLVLRHNFVHEAAFSTSFFPEYSASVHSVKDTLRTMSSKPSSLRRWRSISWVLFPLFFALGRRQDYPATQRTAVDNSALRMASRHSHMPHSNRFETQQTHEVAYDVNELRAAANRAANVSTDGSIVMVTASSDYTAVLVNWLAAMEKLKLRNWLVVCFDDYVRNFLEERGANTCVSCQLGTWHSSIAKREKLRQIWTLRVKMLADVVGAGIAVTLSDLDAIWMKDAHPYMQSADLVASRGSFPPWASELWGAAACMGLIRFNVGSKHFVRTYFLREVIDKGDDQIALNLALNKLRVVWGANLTYVGSTSLVTGETSTGLKIAMLPHSLFIRRCDLETIDPTKLVVRHCYTPKTADSKRTSLHSFGSWDLIENWADAPPQRATNFDSRDPHPAFTSWLHTVAKTLETRRRN